MGSPGSYRSYKPGGIQKMDRLLPPVNGEPKDRRMTFAEAIDLGGLDLRVAAENYLPSKSKDITEDRLRACANAGLTQYEVAKGFGSTQPTISYHAKKWRIKFDVPTPEKREWARQAAADIMARVVEEDPEPTGSIEADQLVRTDMALAGRKPAVINEEFEAEFAMPPANEYTLVFGRSEEQLPELNVAKNGNINIRNCELDVTKRYVVCFRPGMQNVRLDNDKLGKEFKPSGNQFSITCKPIAAALIAAGIELPARYRLDIEEMTGVLL